MWLARTWISERLRQSISNEYAHALERHKAELAAANAVDLERVKASYAQERAVRSLGEDSFREAMRVSHVKRVAAVEAIWSAIIKLGEDAPPVLMYVDVLSEKDLPILLTSRRARPALDALSDEVIQEKILVRNPELASARLLAGPYLFSLFFAYRAIVGRAAWLLMDGRNRNKVIAWYRESEMRELLDTVFSKEEMRTFSALEGMWMKWIRESIETKFQDAASAIIKGEELARDLVRQARAIESAVDEMEARSSIGSASPNAEVGSGESASSRADIRSGAE
jgi:hypothetical protein